jgi:L-ribulokinase
VRVYAELYSLYRQLHDAFGTPNFAGKLDGVMKQLIAIRAKARKS